MNNGKSKLRIKTLIVVGVSLLLFSAFLATNYTNIGTPQWFMDKYIVATYDPTAEIESLVESSGMNDLGEFYFYTGQPSLNDAEEFNINCAELLNEESNILGCYDGQIYLFNVADERIAGIKTVTAAHEMLHAAYDRLSIPDQIKIDELVSKELEQTTDPEILELVDLYADLEPGQEINELHSIFGTEAVSLSTELEEYYDRYFSDRSKVVNANNKYKAVFNELEEQSKNIELKMQALNDEINVLQDRYMSDAHQLNRDIDNFNLKADSGGFASESAFNAERNNLINRQNNLDARLNTLNAKIDEYNGYVEDLKALGKVVDALNNNLNSQSELIE